MKLTTKQTLVSILNKLDDTVRLASAIEANTASLNLQTCAISRIIAKLDPLYGVHYDDPARIQDSKAIEQKVLTQLKADAIAAVHYDPIEEARLTRYFKDIS